MSDELMEKLAAWMSLARRREASEVCIVPNEPIVYRQAAIHGRATIERDPGEVVGAAEISRLAEAILGEDRLGRLGREMGVADGRVKLPDGTYATITAARAGGEVTIVARPVRTVSLDYRRIGVPESIVSAAEARSGLLIVTGLPGSGKTTTAYSILDHLNATRPVHIVTVGYHLEYVLEPKQALVQERQIGVDAPDMLAGIQSAVMQGADVVFVGEIRDREVLQACVRTAELGRLVLIQLHQPTPQAAVQRILTLLTLDSGESPVANALADVFRGTLAQCLLPTIDGGQVAAYGALTADPDVRDLIAKSGQGLDSLCKPRLEDDITRLRDEGRVERAAAEEAVRKLG